mmetsp:Transcript_113226/g.231760  ORF Transcript_113226/g.231760 Transcript_113226/m.231760 type:complete len:92 (+) Transcript_113226:717-992(+)
MSHPPDSASDGLLVTSFYFATTIDRIGLDPSASRFVYVFACWCAPKKCVYKPIVVSVFSSLRRTRGREVTNLPQRQWKRGQITKECTKVSS